MCPSALRQTTSVRRHELALAAVLGREPQVVLVVEVPVAAVVEREGVGPVARAEVRACA